MKRDNRTNTQSNPQLATARPRYGLTLLVAIVFIAGAALAANALRGQASFTGRATLTPLDGSRVDLVLNVTGNVTHLGKSTVSIHSLADVSGPAPKPLPPSTGVITAANGDTVAFTLRWTVHEVAPGVFDVLGPFDITGGTGRFMGAAGNGEYGGRLDANTGICAFAGSYELFN